MDDFRRLDNFSDSTDDPFGSPLSRRERPARREPSASAAQALHRVAGVLLAFSIGGGSLALFLSLLVVNFLPVVLVCLLLLLSSAVITVRFRRSAPDLTSMRLIWRVAPTVGMLYGIALGLAFALGNSQLGTVAVIALAGIGAVAGIVCAIGATVAVNATRYGKRRHDGRTGGAAELVAITVGSLFGGVVVLLWISSTGQTLLPTYIAFGPVVTVLLVGAFLLKSRQKLPGHTSAEW